MLFTRFFLGALVAMNPSTPSPTPMPTIKTSKPEASSTTAANTPPGAETPSLASATTRARFTTSITRSVVALRERDGIILSASARSTRSNTRVWELAVGGLGA
ncbi:hypothetical protein CDV31_011428 [Fusarium ambrosium]|uniref:Secreted protein n=1 Tax=Fusarium ambrosium TaxID=131363 RepID=A0A428TGZ5_9HYPO|nr:hypothetical protein CDV31_011428 [Fusarium ambrosium]